MKILVTGAKGFIGKNLVAELRNRKAGEIFEFDKENSLDDLVEFTKNCDLVFHLAGVNRPKEETEFEEGNTGFTRILLENLTKSGNRAPVIFSSSTQADLDNPYGKSKLAAEKVLFNYSEETGIPVVVYRLPNVFGKWCRPSYNSVVATFCHNIAHGLPITINNPETELNLVYIDDVIAEFINVTQTLPTLPPSHLITLSPYHLITLSPYHLNTLPPSHLSTLSPFHPITFPPSHLYTISLSHLSTLLQSFSKSRDNKSVPDLSDPLTRKLYATYLSYLPGDKFSYKLKMNVDKRGSFTEFLKTPDRGQVSVNISRPGIVKGNHWHHTKNEKFLVVNGEGVIRFRKIGTTEIFEYHVNGEKLEVVDIPPGYTHNIENLGTTDMVTVMWASEAFDAERPDTWYEEV